MYLVILVLNIEESHTQVLLVGEEGFSIHSSKESCFNFNNSRTTGILPIS